MGNLIKNLKMKNILFENQDEVQEFKKILEENEYLNSTFKDLKNCSENCNFSKFYYRWVSGENKDKDNLKFKEFLNYLDNLKYIFLNNLEFKLFYNEKEFENNKIKESFKTLFKNNFFEKEIFNLFRFLEDNNIIQKIEILRKKPKFNINIKFSDNFEFIMDLEIHCKKFDINLSKKNTLDKLYLPMIGNYHSSSYSFIRNCNICITRDEKHLLEIINIHKELDLKFNPIKKFLDNPKIVVNLQNRFTTFDYDYHLNFYKKEMLNDEDNEIVKKLEYFFHELITKYKDFFVFKIKDPNRLMGELKVNIEKFNIEQREKIVDGKIHSRGNFKLKSINETEIKDIEFHFSITRNFKIWCKRRIIFNDGSYIDNNTDTFQQSLYLLIRENPEIVKKLDIRQECSEYATEIVENTPDDIMEYFRKIKNLLVGFYNLPKNIMWKK